MQLRRNHETKGKRGSMALVRISVIAGVLLIFLLFLLFKSKTVISFFSDASVKNIEKIDYVRTFEPVSAGRLHQKKFYSMSYHNEKKYPMWVAYHLRKEHVESHLLSHNSGFLTDPELPSHENVFKEYKSMGYIPGQLVPSEDMAFDSMALEESMYLSSTVPFHMEFNDGIWKELIQQTHRWVDNYGDMYIIAGPVYQSSGEVPVDQHTKTGIPTHIFKIMLVYNENNISMQAFLIPNKPGITRLSQYRTTVDHLEKMTGIDFFHHMLENDTEEQLESVLQVSDFPIDENLYRPGLEKRNSG